MNGIRSEEPNHGELSPSTPAGSYARLEFCQPDGTTVTKDVLRYTTIIGSGPASNIQLLDPAIAEAHCIITLESGLLCFRDLRTQTGTRVNGVAEQVANLMDGDELQVGSFSFRVQTNLTNGTADTQEMDIPERINGGKSAVAQLVFRSLNGKLIRKDLLRPTTLIGSSKGCNVQLVSPEIANVHCVITLESGSLRVRDLRSSSGTCVNDVSIEVAALADGDQLQLGAFCFGIETNLPPKPLSASHLVAKNPLSTEPPDIELQRQALREDRSTLQAAHAQFQSEQAQLQEQLAALELDRAEFLKEQKRNETLRAEVAARTAQLEADQNQFSELQQKQTQQQSPQNGNGNYSEPAENSAVAAVTAKSFPLGNIGRAQVDWLLEGCRFRGFFIGRYRILELLGTGSTGWLYEAEDTQNGRIVALKVLSAPHVNDPGMRTRFDLEARACIGLNHPNIVRTTEIGQVGETQFLVMDVTYGASLQELVELKGPVPWPHACDFAAQVARGLQVIHDSGVVHRDIKPANLLLTHKGELKIIDFGLALIQGNNRELKLKNEFGHDCMGTADYIPPEQAQDSFTVDGTADIYSLGCTLYFTLTGKLPFPVETTAAKLNAHRDEQAVPVDELVPDLPQGVADIVSTMMSKDCGKRYQTAEEVAQVLAPFAKQAPAYFDFTAILESRAATAKKRMVLLAKHDVGRQIIPSVVDLPSDNHSKQPAQIQPELTAR